MHSIVLVKSSLSLILHSLILWRPTRLNISSIKSSEDFQQGDSASTLLYCTAIYNFIKDLQRIFTFSVPALPLFFVVTGTIIGPHALILRAIQHINDHGSRIGYCLSFHVLP
jgi:hypothetical protein